MPNISLKAKRAFLALYYTCMNGIGKLSAGKKPVWLFSERGFDARDNAYHLFKWINANHPEIDSYYVISKNDKV